MYRVLIVDDDHDLAMIIKTKLSKLGECITAHAGYDAINLLKSKTFDVVISDYNMQNGDGASLAHYCVNQNIQIIVVSSFPEHHIKPYLPDNVPFLNKFNAIRGQTLEELIRQRCEEKHA